MTDRQHTIADAELEAALRDLAGALAVPAPAGLPGLDPARRARLRIEQGDGAAARARRWPWLAPTPGRRLGRGFAFALVAVLVVAAIAGAIGLGLPGIRIVPAPSPSSTASAPAATASARPTASPTVTPAPTVASPLGSNLGLGDPVAIAAIDTAIDIPIVLPTAPGVGPPATAWRRDGRLTLVWAASPTLPPLREPGVGLVLSEFRGSLEPGYFQKVLDQGTTIETVRVGGVTGYWISGAPHEIVYVDANGNPVFDSRRSVGDTLLWASGDVTYRLESGLGRDGTVALAATLR
jgi:hypothetical protein